MNISIAKRMTLVGHGETDFNLLKMIQGHYDSALSSRGKGKPSDLKRATETISPLLETVNRSAFSEPKLRGRHFGISQELAASEAQSQHPLGWQQFKNGHELDFDCVGGDHLE